MQPIRPSEVQDVKNDSIPLEIIKVFNDLIVQNWNGSSSHIYQKDALKRVCEVTGKNSNFVYEKKWLDVEDIFRNAGWKVVYDKPSYCEDYEPNWTFTKPK